MGDRRNDHGTLEDNGQFFTKKQSQIQIQLNPLNGVEGTKKIKSTYKDYDEILEVVGGDGKYQKYILYVIIGSFMILIDMPFLNKIFMLSIPSHSCHVHGRPNDTDLTTWKNLTLPKEIGPDGLERFSQCKMLTADGGSVECNEWDYDKSEYDSTVVTDFNWVCHKSNYATNFFTIGFAGNILGSVMFGSAADRWGRKRFVYLTLMLYIGMQTLHLFTPQYYTLYLITEFLSESSMPFLFITPMMMAAEISGKDYRGWIYAAAAMMWVIGISLLPLLAWLLRSWFLIGLATTLPAYLLFFTFSQMPESPRWLIQRGRIDEAEKIILDISQTNQRPIDHAHLRQSLQEMTDKEKNHKNVVDSTSFIAGTFKLFSKKRLALNTILLCIIESVSRLLFGGLTFNATSMVGSEFLNFFLLNLIEVPAAWTAGFTVDRFGRRWSQVGFFSICSLAFIIATFTVFNPALSWLVLIAAVTAKFGCGAAGVVISIQEIELFPTELRSTGNGIANFVSSAVSCGGAYIVYLGQYYAAAPYIFLGLLSVLGAVAAGYLPETLNLNLPETLEEADHIGKNDKFWSFLPHDKKAGKLKKELE